MILMYITEELADKLVEKYYINNEKKIRKLVDDILFRLKFVNVNPDDFYSLANEIFVDVLKRYDGQQDFDSFLYSCLVNKFKTEMTRRNRYKRQIDKLSISINTPIGDKEGYTIGDTIFDKSTIEKEIFEEKDNYSKSMNQYLNRLSKLQREVLKLISVGFTANEIIEELHINKRLYEDCYMAIHSYRNTSILM